MTGTIRLQPLPVFTLVLELDGVTGITRGWQGGDHTRCRLCTRCEAREIPGAPGNAVCTILTEEAVTDSGAPLYSSLGLDFGEGDGTSRARAPLALAP